VKKSLCSGDLWPLRFRINYFGARRAPQQMADPISSHLQAVGCTLAGSREGKMEIMVETGGEG
jgi:hypothetical protein